MERTKQACEGYLVTRPKDDGLLSGGRLAVEAALPVTHIREAGPVAVHLQTPAQRMSQSQASAMLPSFVSNTWGAGSSMPDSGAGSQLRTAILMTVCCVPAGAPHLHSLGSLRPAGDQAMAGKRRAHHNRAAPQALGPCRQKWYKAMAASVNPIHQWPSCTPPSQHSTC